MSGKILRNDVIDEEAILKSISNVVKGMEDLAKSMDSVKQNTPKSSIEELTFKEAELAKQHQQLGKLTAQLETAQNEYNKKIIQAQVEKKKYNEALKESITGEKADAKARRDAIVIEKQQQSMTKLLIAARQTEAGSLSRLNAINAVYKQRMKELNVLIPVQAKQYARLTQSIANNQAKTAAMMHQMVAGTRQGADGFNMLNFQIQQVARELPSIAYGANIFFAAISNNLPMLIDEIGRTRKEVALLQAQGKATVPVWRQVVGSIFSWQTAMVAAITVLTLYGQEIVKWIGGLFKAKTAIDAVKIAQDNLNEANKNAVESSSQEITKLNILYNASQNQKLSLEDRKKAIDELQREYPDYLGNLSDEEILAGRMTSAYENLRDAIIEKAKAQAYADKIAENYVKIAELEEKKINTQIELQKAELELSKEQAISKVNVASTTMSAAGSLDAFNATMEAPAISKRDNRPFN